MSEKEKNIVPSTAEAEMSEEEKQKLLEQFDKESKTRKFGSPVLRKLTGYSRSSLPYIIWFSHPVFTCRKH